MRLSRRISPSNSLGYVVAGLILQLFMDLILVFIFKFNGSSATLSLFSSESDMSEGHHSSNDVESYSNTQRGPFQNLCSVSYLGIIFIFRALAIHVVNNESRYEATNDEATQSPNCKDNGESFEASSGGIHKDSFSFSFSSVPARL